mmetsp:Transcript_37956/g.95097  ORF Transcript_37956/g.95097 Transcript_37956/m.95097 type:complete len:203 (+) Transcript_37956:299-907(+)
MSLFAKTYSTRHMKQSTAVTKAASKSSWLSNEHSESCKCHLSIVHRCCSHRRSPVPRRCQKLSRESHASAVTNCRSCSTFCLPPVRRCNFIWRQTSRDTLTMESRPKKLQPCLLPTHPPLGSTNPPMHRDSRCERLKRCKNYSRHLTRRMRQDSLRATINESLVVSLPMSRPCPTPRRHHLPSHPFRLRRSCWHLSLTTPGR